MAARLFNGTARIDAKKGFVKLVSGDAYSIPSETQELINDVLEGAKTHELTVSVFIPEYSGTPTKFGETKTYTVEQLQNVMKKRSMVILQGKDKTYPAPYMALLPRKVKEKEKAKDTGPDLNRKAKDTGPDLNRKR